MRDFNNLILQYWKVSKFCFQGTMENMSEVLAGMKGFSFIKLPTQAMTYSQRCLNRVQSLSQQYSLN